jgi:hypothetical protein
MRWEFPLCSRPGRIQASKSSSIFFVRTALHHRQFFSNSCFSFHSSRFGTPAVVWEEFPPVIALPYVYVLSHFCSIMILTCASPPDIMIAGGLFHFKKDNAQYSLKPEDYATKPRQGLPCPRRSPRRRWGFDAGAAASPAPGAAPGGAWGFDAGERYGACAVGRRGWC